MENIKITQGEYGKKISASSTDIVLYPYFQLSPTSTASLGIRKATAKMDDAWNRVAIVDGEAEFVFEDKEFQIKVFSIDDYRAIMEFAVNKK